MNLSIEQPHILIVEDDFASRALLVSYFESEGYRVSETDHGESLVQRVLDETINLVLGIILVTSKGDEIDRIVGLELGADDYVTKPFNPRELLVRAKNLLWRVTDQSSPAEKGNTSELIHFEGWTLDCSRRLLESPEEGSERLPEGEFKLFYALISSRGQVLSRDQLMDAIHDREWTPNDRSIDVLIGRLRRKLNDNPLEPHFILTAHGAGYMFAGEVK